MKGIKPIVVFTITITVTFVCILEFPEKPSSYSFGEREAEEDFNSNSNSNFRGMAAARSFILWLHGLGDSGPANEPIRTLFTSPEFRNTKWSFPSAPSAPVTCNYGSVMPSWFDIQEIPVTATPILWSHGLADRTVLFEAGQAGPPFLEKIGVGCEFKAYPGLAHSINNEELRYLESWIKARLQSSS